MEKRNSQYGSNVDNFGQNNGMLMAENTMDKNQLGFINEQTGLLPRDKANF
jgi:hypothetical protein